MLLDQATTLTTGGYGMTVNKEREFWEIPLDQLLAQLGATPQGLTTAEAENRLHRFGPNSLARESRFALAGEIVRLFGNPLVLILLGAAIISAATGERVSALIIISIILLSVFVNFYQSFQARRAVEELRSQVASKASVVRDRREQEIAVADLVPGDVIKLNAGDLVPADARLLEEKDLQVRESALTGESLPVEKEAADLTGGSVSISEATNSVFLGTTVQTGLGTAVVVGTGAATAFGAIAARLAQRPPETEFDRGIHRFGLMITRVILLLVVFVFVINVWFHRPLLESLLFSIALAVGLTPELLPVVISATLAQGARTMARKKVIVKQLASIENFGSIEILCSDKTGTLTEGEIVLDRHLDAQGRDDDRVMQLLYLNSFFEAGIKSPLDDAILRHSPPAIDEYNKLDEIPFDFGRRRLSVVVRRGAATTLITKGAAEDVFDVCTSVRIAEAEQPFDAAQRQAAEAVYQSLGAEGYRVLGVAIKAVGSQATYTRDEEREMVLVGFGAFLDPPKEGVQATLQALHEDGIAVVVMTGDNEHVTQKIARDVGLPAERVLVGKEVDGLDDAALAYQAEHGAIFARVSPEQKNRVMSSLRARGRVVGFLGDGINDAPSLHAADIGISVVNAVDVAKDAASIILLEKDLRVLHDGVVEGRRSFANILKYIIMGTSSNFGNMFSMAAASLLLPFLPMLPTQILLNNLLYDASQLSIPTDNVDPELLRRPRRWRVDFIRQFMVVMGPISSIYDFLTFGVLLGLFHANERLFHTGWFVESLATQTLVVFVIRTAANPFRSRPSRTMLISVAAIVLIGVLWPYTPLGPWLGFRPLPALLLGALVVLTVTYLVLVQAVKTWFYRRHGLG
jgi:Mg2+-importing ATPase